MDSHYQNYQHQMQQQQYSGQGDVKQERDRRDDDRRDRSRNDRRDDRPRNDRRRDDRDRGHRDDRRDKDREREREREKDRERDRKRSRSPTPPRRRRRRPTRWDIPPTGLPVGGRSQATLPPPPGGISLQGRQAKRLYVGNLPLDVKDQELAEFISESMFRAGKTKDNNPHPVVSVQFNNERTFAFVDFSAVEDANTGMTFDGLTFKGVPLKIRRPKDFRGGEVEVEETFTTDPNTGSLVSTNVAEGPNKIFIGGLPAYLNEEQVKELLSSFGQLKSFNLVKDSTTGTSKGYAFFEYTDGGVTDKACSGLNGMKLGEKSIIVQRANVGAKSNQTLVNPYTKSILTNVTALHFLNLQMPLAAACALLGLNINEPQTPTRIVQLCNMISADDIDHDEDYKEICEEVMKEAETFGTVVSMYIARPIPEEETPEMEFEMKKPKIQYGLGRIFIEYKRKEDAKRAHEGFAGRKFNSRTIVSGFFSEEKYAMKNFEPEPEEEKASVERFQKVSEEHKMKYSQQAEDEYY